MSFHITGASGSGVSTLGRALADALGFAMVDADDFYRLATEPRFTQPRDRDERLKLVLGTLSQTRDAVFAGIVPPALRATWPGSRRGPAR